MRVRVSPGLQPQLIESLRRGDCFVAEAGDGTVLVQHPWAAGPEEARLELEFFLRAWGAGHPDAELALVP